MSREKDKLHNELSLQSIGYCFNAQNHFKEFQNTYGTKILNKNKKKIKQ